MRLQAPAPGEAVNEFMRRGPMTSPHYTSGGIISDVGIPWRLEYHQLSNHKTPASRRPDSRAFCHPVIFRPSLHIQRHRPALVSRSVGPKRSDCDTALVCHLVTGFPHPPGYIVKALEEEQEQIMKYRNAGKEEAAARYQPNRNTKNYGEVTEREPRRDSDKFTLCSSWLGETIKVRPPGTICPHRVLDPELPDDNQCRALSQRHCHPRSVEVAEQKPLSRIFTGMRQEGQDSREASSLLCSLQPPSS
ncbi:hypothetical protein P7K49_025041 [Saguinus oedipus]|uniref:Uncharacterized protein n=1 Tax=Saguinus oedipus TaxID=9490 RepID=A0ABQ9UIA3_SAGOE|nr:hypothetical protein P7K49_025041 [Saguinus oedipus]